MRSIGFGAERLGLFAIRFPRLAVLLSLTCFALSVFGLASLRFVDETPRVFTGDSTAAAAYDRLRARVADASNAVLLVVEGDFADPDARDALARLAARLEARPSVAEATSVLSLAELGRGMALTGGPGLEEPPLAGTAPPAPAALAAHPLNQGLLLSSDLSLAAIALEPTGDPSDIADLRQLQAEVEAVAETEAPGLRTRLTGLPVARGRVMEALQHEQPILLGLGLAIGFGCGVLLLGRLSDALVIAAVPVFTVTAAYGLIALSGLQMTVLLNNLPLLILALGFANSMHLVYDARRRLFAADYDFAALGATIRQIGPACALSIFTTMLAFLCFEVSGSEAIREFGRVGAVSVLGVFVACMLVHPATVFVALRLGWRPLPSERGSSRVAHALQAGAARLARRQLGCPRRVLAAGLALTLAAGFGSLQVAPGYAALEQVPASSQTFRTAELVEARLGGLYPIQLRLPIVLSERGATATALARLRRVHEAVEAAFPGRPLLSATSVIRWLQGEGISAGAATLRALFERAPRLLRDAVVTRDGRHAMLTVWVRGADDLRTAADALEDTAGAVLGVDLAGQASGFAVLSARTAPAIIERLQAGLILAALGASALMALAFRRAAVLPVGLLPNLLPVLAVGAALAALGVELTLATALAMTVALGIAVDDTVHMTAAYVAARPTRSAGCAVVEAAGAVGPVLIVTTLVLTLGLAPALLSWSPATAAFAAFAVATIGLALLTDLGLLPALLALGLARHRDGPDG